MLPPAEPSGSGGKLWPATLIEVVVVLALLLWAARLYSRGQLLPTLLYGLQVAVTCLVGSARLLLAAARARCPAAVRGALPFVATDAKEKKLAEAASAQSSVPLRPRGIEMAAVAPSGYDLPLVGLAPGETNLLSPRDFRELLKYLPPRCAGKTWRLLFSTSQHGYSLATLYSRVRGHGPTMLLVLDDRGCVFGGFASRDWSGNDLVSSAIRFSFGGSGSAPTSSYFGSGETFLFSCQPQFRVHRWTQRNNEFMMARRDLLAFGGGGGKFGLSLDAALDRGSSGACDTFGNPPLAGGAGAGELFRAVRVEVWGFILPGLLHQEVPRVAPAGQGISSTFSTPAVLGFGGGKALA